MRHMKLFRNRLFLLLLVIPALFSCRRYEMISGSSVITPFEKCFSNDSLKFSLSTYAPYDLNTKKVSKKDRKLLKQIKVEKGTKVFFIGFNDFNHPHYLIALLENKDFDLSAYKRMKRNPQTYYSDDVKAKLDTFPIFYKARSIGKNYIYEAALPFANYTTRLLHVTDSIIEDKYMSEFNPYGVDFSQGPHYAPCSPDNPFTLAWEAFKSNDEVNYLKPLQLLRENKSDYQKASEKGMLYQALANYFSLINEQDSVAYYWGKLNTKPIDKTLPEEYLLPASPKILELAKTNRVIMFNEAHTNPTHRHYVGLLLDSLYALGFRYLALEALGQDSTINKHGFPTINSGFYTNEPTMANLIRYAKHLGYQLMGYDSESSNREYDQAKNIFDKTFTIEPLARVVVLAGHGHINESTQSGRKMMAAYFREISDINPVTVDQTALEGFTLPQLTTDGAYILNDEGMQSLKFPVQIQSDFKVYNDYSPVALDNCFSSSQSSKVSIEVPKDSLDQKQNHILLVYKAEELTKGIQPVPTAIKYLKENNVADAKLCPGEYAIVVKNYNGDIVWQHKIQVK